MYLVGAKFVLGPIDQDSTGLGDLVLTVPFSFFIVL